MIMDLFSVWLVCKLRSGIEDLSFKEDVTWYINPENTLKFGMDITCHEFNPGEIKIGESTDFKIALGEKKAFESALYIQNEQKITSRFSANYGLRFSAIQSDWSWLVL